MPRARGNKAQVPELYDLEKDRQEKDNIASQHPEIIKAMRDYTPLSLHTKKKTSGIQKIQRCSRVESFEISNIELGLPNVEV
jgi:hypothetical protein